MGHAKRTNDRPTTAAEFLVHNQPVRGVLRWLLQHPRAAFFLSLGGGWAVHLVRNTPALLHVLRHVVKCWIEDVSVFYTLAVADEDRQREEGRGR